MPSRIKRFGMSVAGNNLCNACVAVRGVESRPESGAAAPHYGWTALDEDVND
jgi:hypothetical protein